MKYEHDGMIAKEGRDFLWSLQQGALEWDDLMQAGRMGAEKARERFDASKGASFVTYARYWVRRYMNDAAQRHGRTVRVPAHSSYDAWKRGAPIRITRVSLDTWHDGEPRETDSLLNVLGFVQAPDELEQRDEASEKALIEGAMRRLPKRYRDVLRAYFYDGKNLREIAAPLGVTRERTRQIKYLALQKLKLYLRGRVEP